MGNKEFFYFKRLKRILNRIRENTNIEDIEIQEINTHEYLAFEIDALIQGIQEILEKHFGTIPTDIQKREIRHRYTEIRGDIKYIKTIKTILTYDWIDNALVYYETETKYIKKTKNDTVILDKEIPSRDLIVEILHKDFKVYVIVYEIEYKGKKANTVIHEYIKKHTLKIEEDDYNKILEKLREI